MLTIALISQKGGTGKTTIATSLAVAAVARGLSTVIIDIDAQANAANWRDRREEEGDPLVAAPNAGRLVQELEKYRALGADLALIDTAGKASSDGIAAARAADLVLVPTHDQSFDIETLKAVREILDTARNPNAVIVMNGIHPNARSPVDRMAGFFMREYGLATAPVFLTLRAAYADAPGNGQAAQELDPTGRTAQEIGALLDYVLNSTIAISQNSNEAERSRANGL